MKEPTCQNRPSPLLVNNYQDCLRQRLESWFGDRATFHAEPGAWRFRAELEELSVWLEFLPERCRWRLEGLAEPFEGSFDRVTKRLRQHFSRISPAGSLGSRSNRKLAESPEVLTE